jgi:hypothetical protein
MTKREKNTVAELVNELICWEGIANAKHRNDEFYEYNYAMNHVLRAVDTLADMGIDIVGYKHYNRSDVTKYAAEAMKAA